MYQTAPLLSDADRLALPGAGRWTGTAALVLAGIGMLGIALLIAGLMPHDAAEIAPLLLASHGAMVAGGAWLAARQGARAMAVRDDACARSRDAAHAAEGRARQLESEAAGLAAQIAVLDTDFADLGPYLENLREQIAGVETDVGAGVSAIIERVCDLNARSSDQLTRIHRMIENGDALARSAERPKQIIARLEAALEARDQQLRANYASLQSLAAEFDTVRPMVDVISQIADKTFLLSINAGIEGARAGSSSATFRLVAEEVRNLSGLTTSASKDIANSIATFTTRMRTELAKTLPEAASDGAKDRDGIGDLIGELGLLQDHFVEGGKALVGVLQEIDGGHQQMVERLSGILGHVQFHDVMRQRLEQVAEALLELDDHARHSLAGARDPSCAFPQPGLRERMERQLQSYVMFSQRAVHHAVVNGDAPADQAGPKIQLF